MVLPVVYNDRICNENIVTGQIYILLYRRSYIADRGLPVEVEGEGHNHTICRKFKSRIRNWGLFFVKRVNTVHPMSVGTELVTGRIQPAPR